MRWYTPLHDICLRPKLPSVNGPAIMLGIAGVFKMAPGDKIMDFAAKQALNHSYTAVKASLGHIGGNILKYFGLSLTDAALRMPSFTLGVAVAYIGEWCVARGNKTLQTAAKIAAPKLMRYATHAATVCKSMNLMAAPIAATALAYAGWVVLRHITEPPPYEAPPGCYPSGGPMIEIAQEEAPQREMVFCCPGPLARRVQERVLLCERDPTIIQKVKSIAAKWCDDNNLNDNQRYTAICGAVAAAMTVPASEQLVLQLAQSHAVQQQHYRIANYLSGIKHTHDPWYTKYFLIRR